MTNEKHGGHAFPQNQAHMGNGMTLRDYFAAKAMQGMNANTHAMDWSHENIAVSAYAAADAMLAAREVQS